MNKKGFTLIELISVVVILSLVITVVTTNGFGLFNRVKGEITKENVNAIKKGVNILLSELETCDDDLDNELITIFENDINKNNYPNTCEGVKKTFKNEECVYIYLIDLLDYKYVSGSAVEQLSINNPYAKVKVCNGKIKDIIDLNNTNDDNGDTLVDEGKTLREILLETSVKIKDSNTGNIETINEKKEIVLPITGPANNKDNSGIYTLDDDYGTSYIFRGTIINNYIEFARNLWKVVRINGDGTIRIEREGDLICSYNIPTNGDKYKEIDDFKKHYSYPYTTTESLDYSNSLAKIILEDYYNKNLIRYENFISESSYCNDKTISTCTCYKGGSPIGEKVYNGSCNECLIEGNSYVSIYSSFYRFKNGTPTLNCNSSDTYKLKIGMLSLDEVLLKGAYLYDANYDSCNTKDETKKDYRDTSVKDSYYTMTPHNDATNYVSGAGLKNSDADIWHYDIEKNRIYSSDCLNNNRACINPVINLKDSVLYLSGEGTKENPYKLKI